MTMQVRERNPATAGYPGPGLGLLVCAAVLTAGCHQPAAKEPPRDLEPGSQPEAQASAPDAARSGQPDRLKLERVPGAKPRNVIFILSDDHRFDFVGFTGKVPWLQTPHLDRLAAQGVHFPNAFVTTSLCSPSRASILTGLYSHQHTIVDNHAPEPKDLTYFPQYLQAAGYETAFIGKWHMGDESDAPRPGFDHWESFKGQGEYYAPTLNINGKRVSYPASTYITDLLTEHAIEWLSQQKGDKPFFLYLSHKAVHAMFKPAQRHDGRYQDQKIPYPPSYDVTRTDEYQRQGIPEWVKAQRHSWHGVDYMYHGQLEFDQFHKRYCETLLGIDDSIGKVMAHLDQSGLAESTVLIYTSDNGFSFGERGLIDKRHAYEESIKVPFVLRWPEVVKGGTTISQMIQNIDIAPTLLELAGLMPPQHMVGKSFVGLLRGETPQWRDRVFYEYYWEYDFPMTPTVHAVRTDQYKYIRYHGLWSQNELYDLKADPNEVNNLIAVPEHQDRVRLLAGQLYDWLESTGGMQIPLKRTVKHRFGDYKNKGTY